MSTGAQQAWGAIAGWTGSALSRASGWALSLEYPYRLTPAKLVGTDLAHAIPLAFTAGAGHLALGNVDFGLLGSLLTGSIPGILLGSILSTRVSEGLLRNAIALVLLFVGARLLS